MDNKNSNKNMLSKSVNFNITGGLPSNINDGGISSYINMVKNIPHLSPEEEYDLAVIGSDELWNVHNVNFLLSIETIDSYVASELF